MLEHSHEVPYLFGCRSRCSTRARMPLRATQQPRPTPSPRSSSRQRHQEPRRAAGRPSLAPALPARGVPLMRRPFPTLGPLQAGLRPQGARVPARAPTPFWAVAWEGWAACLACPAWAAWTWGR